MRFMVRKPTLKGVQHLELANAVGFTMFGAFAGQLVQALPTFTSIWGMVACLAILVAINFLGRFPPHYRWWVGFALLAVFVVSVVKGLLEYTGANYPLNYRVCGRPNRQAGYVDNIQIGIEETNHNKIDLLSQGDPDNYSLTSGRYNDPSKPEAATAVIHPSGSDPDDDAKTNRHLRFDPPLAPQDMSGYLHTEFKYGTRLQGLKRTLVIDGDWTVWFNDDASAYVFTFRPSPKSTFGYDGPCDMDLH
jgi:hypothetical protein